MISTLTNEQTTAYVNYAGAGRRRHADAFMGRCLADMRQLYDSDVSNLHIS